jgi:hypothetical protein
MYFYQLCLVRIVLNVILIWNIKKRLLVNKLQKAKIKMQMQTIIKELKMNNLTMEQAQERINMVNSVLAQKHFQAIQSNNLAKPKFSEKIFIISSMVLGILITISSFIWGIL